MSDIPLALVGAVLFALTNATAAVLLTRRAERRHPPHGCFVEVGGVALHFVERGPQDAPAVVLLHGNGGTIADMEASGLVDRLATRHRVICFDRPGFGWSTRPRGVAMTPEGQAALIAAALDRLGVGRAVVLGHSWGALVALALALQVPAGVAGLVLVAGYTVPTDRRDVLLAAEPPLPGLGLLLRWGVLPLVARLLAPWLIGQLFAPCPVADAFRRRFPLELALRPSHARAAAEDTALMIPAARRLSALYCEIACPAAVFHAPEDRLVEPQHGPLLHDLLPDSVLHVVAGCGHMLHYAVPDAIVAEIERLSTPACIDAPTLQPDPVRPVESERRQVG